LYLYLGIDIGPSAMVEEPERFYQFGKMFFVECSFSSAWKKTNQKKTPMSRMTLRVAASAGARGNSPALQGST